MTTAPVTPPVDVARSAPVEQHALSAPAAVARSLPGLGERIVTWIACFVVFYGLPMDWFQTRDDAIAAGGNLRLVLAELGLMGLGVLRVAGSFDWILRLIRLDAALFAFAGLAMASTFWSADPGETFRQSVIFTTATLFGAYLVLRYPLAEILQIWALVFAVGTVINYAFVFAVPFYAVGEKGWDGIFLQKNALGWVCLVSLPTLLLAGRAAPRLRVIYYLAAAGTGGLLLGSQSKTMLLASIGTVGLMSTYRLFRSRRTVRGALYLVLLAAVAAMVLLVFINLADLTELLDRDVSFTGRVPLWQMLLPFALAEPLLGYGYKAVFTGYFGPVHEIWVLERWNPSHAHNELLNIWLQVGLVGVALYVFTLLRALRRSVNTITALSGGAGLWPLVFFTAAILMSISESGMSANTAGWMMFVVAALSAAASTRLATLEQ